MNYDLLPLWAKDALLKNPLLMMLITSLFGVLIVYFKQVPSAIWNFLTSYIFVSIKLDHRTEAYWLLQQRLSELKVTEHFKNICIENASTSVNTWAFSTAYNNHRKNTDTTIHISAGYGKTLFKYEQTWYIYHKQQTVLQGNAPLVEVTLTALTTSRHNALKIVRDLEDMIPKTSLANVYLYQEKGWRQAGEQITRTFDSIVQPPGVIDYLMADADKFIVSKSQFEKTGTPYRRSYIFHGKWGTGKTSAAMAFAKYLN